MVLRLLQLQSHVKVSPPPRFSTSQTFSLIPSMVSVSQMEDSGVSLLPRRVPEALEYIPLGRKRNHSDDPQEEAPPKKVKSLGIPPSESTDGFTYMGKVDVPAGSCWPWRR